MSMTDEINLFLEFKSNKGGKEHLFLNLNKQRTPLKIWPCQLKTYNDISTSIKLDKDENGEKVYENYIEGKIGGLL